VLAAVAGHSWAEMIIISEMQHNRRACAGAPAAPGQLSNHMYTYQQWIRGLAAAPGLKPGPQEGTFAVLTLVTFGYFILLYFILFREKSCSVSGIIIENRRCLTIQQHSCISHLSRSTTSDLSEDRVCFGRSV
jgi:hypothetical protein